MSRTRLNWPLEIERKKNAINVDDMTTYSTAVELSAAWNVAVRQMYKVYRNVLNTKATWGLRIFDSTLSLTLFY